MLQVIQTDFWMFPDGPDFLLKSLQKLEGGHFRKWHIFHPNERGNGLFVQPSKHFELRKINPLLMIS
jgi:hypothetical protein